MRIWIQGQSEMIWFLKKICTNHGMVFSAPEACDLAIMNFPYSSFTEELKEAFPKGQKVICGIIDAKTDQISKDKKWEMYFPLKDEQYLSENAKMTAEGAVASVMNKIPYSLRKAKILVIGYGRIGKELTRLLRSFEADVTVAARREESRSEAGPNSIEINRIQSFIGTYDLVLNAVPSTVISESGLLCLKNTAFLFELASKPYGFDMERAKSLGIHAYLESGIPGRYCPESAAEALFRFVERSVQIE